MTGIICRYIALAATLIASATINAHAEKRIALVIGNATYQNTPTLSNPVNDGEDLAAALKRVGFTVVLERNLNKRGMENAIARFARMSQDADTTLFFYAGHGMQWRGLNYLVPVDARMEDEFNLNFELTRLDDLLFGLEQARGVKILILDACRNNPLFDRLMRHTNKRDLTPTRGLAKIEATSGMVVAYSTQINQVAIDGDGRNSPFVSALVKELEEPGLEIGTLFRRIALEVNRTTDGRQLPELSVSLLGEFYFNKRETDLQAWSKVRLSDDPRQLKKFIEDFPKSLLVPDARQRLDAIERERADQGRIERERLARTQAEQAERGRAEMERLAREQAEREQVAALEQVKLEEERQRVAREQAERNNAKTQTAMLPPAVAAVPSISAIPALSGTALVQEIKKELKRVGCYSGRIDDKWTTADTKSSIEKFVKFANLPKTPDTPATDFLAAIRTKSERICPIECGAREIEKDGKCVAIPNVSSASGNAQPSGSGRKCLILGNQSFCE